MSLQSKKASLLILGITSLVCSRVLFIFFDDPEGPNLLVVIGMSLVIYFLSLALSSFVSYTGLKKLVLILFIQVLIATGFFFCLN